MRHSENVIKEGALYPIIVTKLLARGIVVQLEDTGKTEFIHISRISKQFVSNITDYVNIGQSFVAQGVKGRDGMNELSLIHLNLNQQEPSKQVLPRVVEEPSANKRLDEMIAAAETSMHDKVGRIQARAERKRRKRER